MVILWYALVGNVFLGVGAVPRKKNDVTKDVEKERERHTWTRWTIKLGGVRICVKGRRDNGMICTNCRVSRDIREFRWENAKEGFSRKRKRFDDAIHDGRVPDAADCTKICRTCRDRNISFEAPYARRVRECQEWYRAQLTACVECSENRPQCLGLFRTDQDETIKPLSQASHWAAAARGVDAMERVRDRFEVSCFFCKSVHPFHTGPATTFDRWLDGRMETEGSCTACGRETTADTIRGFQFAHMDSMTKTVHPTLGPLSMMTLRQAVRRETLSFEEAITLASSEWSRGRVLCHNCHRMETLARTGRVTR